VISVSDLKAMAGPVVAEIARECAPEGKLSGAYWIAKSPLRVDRRRGSFCVWIRGPAAGAWKDFASDDKGDLVDLIAETKYGGRSAKQRGEAIAWLRERLGLASSSPQEVLAKRVEARKRKAEAERAEEIERERKMSRATTLWLSGKPLGGTLGEVYLRARGVEGRTIANLAATFRFLARLDYWKEGTRHCGPAIVGRYRDALGNWPAIHATWLSEDGLGKADLDPPKLSYGPYAGCFLPIALGDSGFLHWEADAPAAPVQVAEGPEDAWTLAQARPDLRTWAAGSLSNIGNLPFLPCVSAFLVVRQNDWKTPAAVKAFDAAIAKLRAHGVPVEEIGVALGKDPNDQLRGVLA